MSDWSLLFICFATWWKIVQISKMKKNTKNWNARIREQTRLSESKSYLASYSILLQLIVFFPSKLHLWAALWKTLWLKFPIFLKEIIHQCSSNAPIIIDRFIHSLMIDDEGTGNFYNRKIVCRKLKTTRSQKWWANVHKGRRISWDICNYLDSLDCWSGSGCDL